jgi:hypothetical protein
LDKYDQVLRLFMPRFYNCTQAFYHEVPTTIFKREMFSKHFIPGSSSLAIVPKALFIKIDIVLLLIVVDTRGACITLYTPK